MNLGESEQQQHLQILIWRAMDTRAESETARSTEASISGDRENASSAWFPLRIGCTEIVRCNANFALSNCGKTARTEREELS